MDLSKILSISGKRGLFRVVSQLKNAMLVESLVDKKRYPAFAHEKISSLEEIAIFTTGEDIQLKDVLKAMFEKLEGRPAVDSHSPDNVLKSFFTEIVPEYDPERVYISDIKKILSWYNLLQEQNLLDFTEKEEETKKGLEGESKEEKSSEEETAPKVAIKKKKAYKKETSAQVKPTKKTSSGSSKKRNQKDK